MADFEYKQPQRIRITNRQRDEQTKRKSGSSGGIPDRWLDYLGVNTWIENTRFIAFKCPLKPEIQKHLPDDRRFTLADLVEKLDDRGKELGLIIDLTNTDRYYKATDIADAQIQYHKLMTPGHNQIPNEACYQQFAQVVRNFLDKNQTNDKLIGVHCTHGLNRTGYLIVRYMIEQFSWDPNEALETFNRSRGHAMEKYTEDLLRRKALTSESQTVDITTNDNENHDEIQWPSLYSTVENLTLKEKRKQPKERVITGSIPTENCSTPVESQKRSTSSISNRFPSLLLTKQDEDEDQREYLPPRRSQPMPSTDRKSVV